MRQCITYGVSFLKLLWLFVCLSGRRRLEIRSHGGGQSISLGVYNCLCVWNFRGISTATTGEHRKVLRMHFPFIFWNSQMLYLFYVPYHKERDIKLSTQVPHLLKLMARWKKRTLLQIGRLNARLCSTEDITMFDHLGAQSWWHPQASLLCTCLTSRKMNDHTASHAINIKPRWKGILLYLQFMLLISTPTHGRHKTPELVPCWHLQGSGTVMCWLSYTCLCISTLHVNTIWYINWQRVIAGSESLSQQVASN